MAVGTFLSVLSLSFAVFQYWRKKQDEKFDLFRTEIRDTEARHEKRLSNLENMMSQKFENRLSVMEGELKGIKAILQSINNWFINGGGKQNG
jgi:hypothetical protein